MGKVNRIISNGIEIPINDVLFNKIKTFIETKSNGKLLLVEDHRHVKNGVPVKINYKITYGGE